MATLKVGGLTKRHRNIAAVNDVRFGVERAGPTGCLRTLISMALCRLWAQRRAAQETNDRY